MGRPRKQPRRILTFNLNTGLADAIDALPIKNRSEWANKVLQEVLDGRVEAQEMKSSIARDELRIEAEDALLESLRLNPARLTILLLNSLTAFGIGDEKVRGRYSIEEQLLSLRNELINGRLQAITGPSPSGDL
jgi:hypothetical protein